MLGKSIYIWQIPAISGGDIEKIVALVKDAGFQSAILHDAHLANWRTKARLALVAALQTAGIDIWGGAAVYGLNSVIEGGMAAAICNDLGLAGFVFDAEVAFDRVSHPDSEAVKLLQAFKAQASGKLAGWCWWAFHHSTDGRIEYHPKEVLWAAIQPGYGDADFGVPMMYWSWGDGASQAIAYLEASWKQWRMYTDKPLVPAGRAYIGDGGTARPGAVLAFDMRARELGADGVTWWSLQHALDSTHMPGVWLALASLDPFGEAEPEPKPRTYTTFLPSIMKNG